MSYIGNAPLPQATEERIEVTATPGQTSFTGLTYVNNYLDVYLNGVKLASSDFTATDGTSCTLASGAAAGDIVAFVSRTQTSGLMALPLKDSAGNNVLSESGGTVTLTADEANVGSNALVVDSSGNVGIGTSSVSNNSKIDVNGSVISTGNSISTFNADNAGFDFVSSTKSGRIFATSTDTTGGELLIYTGQNGSYSEAMRIDSSGDVEIYNQLRIDRGSTALYPLYLVSSDKYCTIGSLNSSYVHIDTNATSGIYFYDGISVASLNNRSDEVLKTNINTISDALSKVLAIRGVSFEWEVDKYPELKLNSCTNFGVIAQECESLHPEFVKESLHPTDENTSFKSINYLELIPFLIEAIKEQQTLIESQQSQIDALTARIEALEATP